MSFAPKFATAGLIDGSTFHVSYNLLNNSINAKENIFRNLDKVEYWMKDILFITALRWVNSVKIWWEMWKWETILDKIEKMTIIEWEKLKFTEKVWNAIGTKWVSISAETAMLVGIDSSIDIIFGNNIENSPDEVMNIIAMVIWLRLTSKLYKDSYNFYAERKNWEIVIHKLRKVEKEYPTIRNKENTKKDKKQKDENITTGIEWSKYMLSTIPLSELFKNGKDLEEYEQIRDKLINKALTQKWAEELMENEKFKEVRDEFISKYIDRIDLDKLSEIKWKDEKIDKDILIDRLKNDFENMVKRLWNVGENLDEVEWESKQEKQKNAIKDLFENIEDNELAEALTGMYEEFNNNLDKKGNKINKNL